MSSISTFLNTAMTIDQQEGSSQDNYNYEKEQLGAMYDETKQNLIDSAATALPFGIAETSRAVAGLWQTGKAIQNFSAKYSPQIAEFKAKAATMYENIGKEGAVPTDYADLIKSAGTALGKKALELAAPEVMKRTGIDLKQAVTASKGEGGVEAGLENLRSQGVNIVKTKATAMVEAGVSQAKAAVAPIVEGVREAVAPVVEAAVRTPASVFAGSEIQPAEETGIVGVGAEAAARPSLTTGTDVTSLSFERTNPVFEFAKEPELFDNVGKLKEIAGKTSSDVVSAASKKAIDIHESVQAAKTKLQSEYATKRAALETEHADVTAKLAASQEKVAELSKAGGFKEVEGGNAMYGRGRTGVTPGVRRPNIEATPELTAARADVAAHTASLADIQTRAGTLTKETTASVEAIKGTAVEGLTALKSTAQTALGVAKGVGGAALEVMGVVGAEESIRSLATSGGRVGGEQGTSDAGGIYGGIRSAQALGTKGITAARQALGLGEKAGEKVAETGGEKVAESTGIKVGEAATRQLASGAIKEGGTAAVEGGLEATAETVGKEAAIKVGTSLAAEGAELGTAAAVGSAIPIVGEALDIGLGLYTVIDSFVNLFKKPPAPPPPPPVQQQIVAVTHQQGIY